MISKKSKNDTPDNINSEYATYTHAHTYLPNLDSILKDK